MSDEVEIDIEAQTLKYKEDFLKHRGDYDKTAPTFLKIPGLTRLKLSEIYHPNEAVYLAYYVRGYQVYRLANTNYGLICDIRVEHYDQNDFYNTKEYDESILSKLEFGWVKLRFSNSGDSAGRFVIESKVSHFNEVLDNCPKEVTSSLLYYIDLFTENKES